MFSILPKKKQLPVQCTGAIFLFVISLIITSGSSASQSTVRRAIEAADAISLGTTHLKDCPLGKTLLSLRPRSLLDMQKEGPHFGFPLQRFRLCAGMGLAEYCAGGALSHFTQHREMDPARNAQDSGVRGYDMQRRKSVGTRVQGAIQRLATWEQAAVCVSLEQVWTQVDG